MLKSIAAREFNKLYRILGVYVKYCQEHPDSLLTKFYGMYRLEWRDPTDKRLNAKPVVSHLIVMQNLFKSFDCGLRFDLKGSTISRTRLKAGQKIDDEFRDINVALKDNDFTAWMQPLQLVECIKQDMPPLKDVLEEDTTFLSKLALIDYSFLLGQVKQTPEQVRKICKHDPALGRGVYIDTNQRVWLCGIIDPLNEYDYYKQAEYYVKTLKTAGGNGMSCVPPSIYQPRFLNYMNKILVEDRASNAQEKELSKTQNSFLHLKERQSESE